MSNIDLLLSKIRSKLDTGKSNSMKVFEIYAILSGSYGKFKNKLLRKNITSLDYRNTNKEWFRISDINEEPSDLMKALHKLKKIDEITGSWQHLLNSSQYKAKEDINYKRYITIVTDGSPESVIQFHKIVQIYIARVIVPCLENKVPFSTKMIGSGTGLIDHIDTIVFHTTNEKYLYDTEVYFTDFFEYVKSRQRQKAYQNIEILTPKEREEYFLRPTFGVDLKSCSSDTGSMSSYIVSYTDKRRKDGRMLTNLMIKEAMTKWLQLSLQDKVKWAKLCKDLDMLRKKNNPLVKFF